jgi:hypothetical protein
MITFGSLTISSHEATRAGPWDRRVQQNEQFGLQGATFIDGKRSTRSLQCNVWLYDAYSTEPDLSTAVDDLNESINTLDTLDISGIDYGFCRFDGVETERRFYSANNSSWLAIGVARFTQMQP